MLAALNSSLNNLVKHTLEQSFTNASSALQVTGNLML